MKPMSPQDQTYPPRKPELIVRDLGVSAYHAMNFKPSSELGRFIEAAEKQLLLPNPVLICENPDRFSRAQIDNADGTLWRLVRGGVDVLFMSGRRQRSR